MINKIITRSITFRKNQGEKPDARLTAWINTPARLETPFGAPVEGTVKYGIKRPIAPATTPLIEIKPGSQMRVDGEIPRYWFVSQLQDVKVWLRVKGVETADEESIEGKTYQHPHRFRYRITKR